MGATTASRLPEYKQDKFVRVVKGKFKTFMSWPRNTPDEIVRETMGDVKAMLTIMGKKVELRQMGDVESSEMIENSGGPRVRKIPVRFDELLR